MIWEIVFDTLQSVCFCVFSPFKGIRHVIFLEPERKKSSPIFYMWVYDYRHSRVSAPSFFWVTSSLSSLPWTLSSKHASTEHRCERLWTTASLWRSVITQEACSSPQLSLQVCKWFLWLRQKACYFSHNPKDSLICSRAYPLFPRAVGGMWTKVQSQPLCSMCDNQSSISHMGTAFLKACLTCRYEVFLGTT